MKRYYLIVLAALLVHISCNKEHTEPRTPTMQYTNLNNMEVKQQVHQTIDINHDGQTDFNFSTLLVGDPILKQDKLWFRVSSRGIALLQVNHQEASPVLNQGDEITLNRTGYEWYGITHIVLAEKITEENKNSYWQGLWKNAMHRYLPVRLQKNNESYYGWIEISFDTSAEKLIMHQMAISTEANVPVKAGE
jgi:hypothetical protein